MTCIQQHYAVQVSENSGSIGVGEALRNACVYVKSSLRVWSVTFAVHYTMLVTLMTLLFDGERKEKM